MLLSLLQGQACFDGATIPRTLEVESDDFVATHWRSPLIRSRRYCSGVSWKTPSKLIAFAVYLNDVTRGMVIEEPKLALAIPMFACEDDMGFRVDDATEYRMGHTLTLPYSAAATARAQPGQAS